MISGTPGIIFTLSFLLCFNRNLYNIFPKCIKPKCCDPFTSIPSNKNYINIVYSFNIKFRYVFKLCRILFNNVRIYAKSNFHFHAINVQKWKSHIV